MSARRRGGRRPGGGAAPRAGLPPEERSAIAFGTWVAVGFLAVGVLLLLLSAVGRGMPYLLGGLDFLLLGGVLLWGVRHGTGPSRGSAGP